MCVFMTMGKVLKWYKPIFTIILHLVVVVVVVQSHTHNSVTGLAINTKLCEYRFSYEDVHRHIKFFVVLVKQQTNSLRQYIMIGT